MVMVASSLSLATGKGRGRALPVAAVTVLEQTLQGSADLGPIADLVDFLRDSRAPNDVHAAAYALHRVFGSLIRQGRLHGRLKTAAAPEAHEAVETVRAWLKARYSAYVALLIAMLPGPQGLMALTILFDLVRTESERLQTPTAYAFADALWSKVVAGLIDEPLPPDVRNEFVLRYLNHFDDVRYYFLRELGRVTLDAARSTNALVLIESLDSMPAYDASIARFWAGAPPRKRSETAKPPARKKQRVALDGSTGIFDSSSSSSSSASDAPAVASGPGRSQRPPRLLAVNAHRAVFTAAWTALIPSIRDDAALKRVLVILHARILPHFTEPWILLDWLGDSCDRGGTVALLALRGLYTLMTDHNLEYPAFYRRLYALLDRQALHVRYRPRFLRMLETFLASTHLPSALVASFAKRLSRLALCAPPAAVVSVLPFVYNLLKHHPSCMVMIHRPGGGAADAYDPECADPLTTGAIDSSLWEVAALASHYLHPTAALARVFHETFTKPVYDLDDFCDHSWSTLFDTEAARVIRKPPSLDLPSARLAKGAHFFPTIQVERTGWSDVVIDVWSQ